MSKLGRTFFLILMGLAVLCAPTYVAQASPQASFSAPDAYRLYGGVIDKSSPTLADLTLDDNGQPEVIVGTTAYNGTNGSYTSATRLEARRGNGNLWFSVDVGAPINSSPAVGDLDGDGEPEVVVSVGGDVGDPNHHGGVRAYSRYGSTLLWSFDTYDNDRNGWREGVFSSPTLCDVDSDGDMEVIFGAWDQRIYMLDHQGNSLWNNIPGTYLGRGFLNGDSIWSTAACVDLNHDGNSEIIIGGDLTAGGVLPDGTVSEDGGFIYVFDKDGNILVRRFVSEAVYAAPAVGDLDGDGDYEIVSGTSWYWWNANGRTDPSYVYVFDTSNVFNAAMDYSDPGKLPHASGWPRQTNYPGFSSPALADLDGDSDLEVVIGTSHPFLSNDGIAGDGSIYAWHHTGQLVSGWPVHPKNQYNDDAPIFSSPTVADVDGDGVQEVLFSMLWDVQVYSANGVLEQRLGTRWTVWGSPAVGDTDGDGQPEIWIGGSHDGDASRGYLWRWELTAAAEIDTPWPMFHRTPNNTRYCSRPPQLAGGASALLLMHDSRSGSSSETTSIFFRNVGEGEIDWQATASSGAVMVTPSSGMTGLSGVTVEVTVSTEGYTEGMHDLGTIRIVGTVDGAPVEGSPIAIPVTLYVGEVHRTYLPLVTRGQ
ncbi:MAG: VCBS repeat-containing protein [Anaerolineae bacterium]|nr:VCBS repeat-containing protein [Anaerolineae bacterium]